jgi:GNAT superfamily N-acetyltransferase
MKWHNDGCWLSDESSDVDMAAVHRLLATTYWASTRPKERTELGTRKSVCFSLKRDDKQIGFARVLTDDGCYAIVVDVVIDAQFQKRGLGRWLLSTISSYPRFEGMVLILWTTDQVDFYKACGLTHQEEFQVMRRAPYWMEQTPNKALHSTPATQEF